MAISFVTYFFLQQNVMNLLLLCISLLNLAIQKLFPLRLIPHFNMAVVCLIPKFKKKKNYFTKAYSRYKFFISNSNFRVNIRVA